MFDRRRFSPFFDGVKVEMKAEIEVGLLGVLQVLLFSK
jgi:hypothetical protein